MAILLVVEDDASIVALIRAVAGPLDLEVVAARGAEAALAEAGRCRPAIISLDVLLPGGDGLSLLGELRRRPELVAVPVVVISARADVAAQRRAYEAGACDFLGKPFPIEVLEAKLRAWLRIAHAATVEQRLRDLAHEVRNPLSALSAAAQVLCRADADPAMRRRMADAIGEEAERVVRLIQVGLSGASPPEPALTPTPHRVLHDILLLNLGDPAVRARVHLECRGALPALRVAPDRLRQVLLNLLDNAVTATAGGGEIFVSAFADPEGVAIAVRDTGVGLDEADLPRLFTDGYTTGGPTARGLGLGITRRLLSECGGHLRVRAAPGQGACFTAWLPR